MANEYEMRQEQRARRTRGLSEFRLKVIGDILMFLSAASMTLIPKLFGATSTDDLGILTVVVLCEAISWVAIPIYAWLLYTGFDRTRSWLKYGVRLTVLALICEVPYDMVTFGPHVMFDMRSQNPVFGLVIALAVLVLLEQIDDLRPAIRIPLSVLIIAIGLLWDFLLRIGQSQAMMNIGMLTLGMCVVFYYLNKRENMMMMTAAGLGALSFIAPALGVVVLHYRNGELGYRHAWTKWAFYATYPLILIVCAVIAAL